MKRILSRGGVFAAALALTFCFGVAVPARAAEITVKDSAELVEALKTVQDNDTIILEAGDYSSYEGMYVSEDNVKGKHLTFVGQGSDSTTWRVGPETLNPAYYGYEQNSDYSFKGTASVTFKDMKLKVTYEKDANYLGFSHTDVTVVEDCVIEGKSYYWGYTSATFTNTTFEAPRGTEDKPEGDYAIWTYSSPTMSFNQCTFNCSGKAINVYTDYDAGKHDITVNVNNCTFNFEGAKKKTALKINDSNMGDCKYVINFTGKNSASGTVDTNAITCSKLFGFDADKPNENSGRTNVYIEGENGDKAVWTGGKMQTHTYTDGYAEQAYDRTLGDWKSLGNGKWMRTETAVCKYCGYTFTTYIPGSDLAYNMNGSTDVQTSDFDTVEHVDSRCAITTAVPVRAGYKFVKWNTAADGSGTSYNPGDTFTFEDAAPATLYAQWEKVESGAPVNPTPTDPTSAAATKKVTKTVPKTGDVTNVALPAVIAVLAVVAIAAALFVRRKNQQ